jgi:transcription initiation factor TFIIH subunit 1
MARKFHQSGFPTPKLLVSSRFVMKFSTEFTVVTALFCSKEGAAQVKLKLGLVRDDAGHNFTFTSPQAVAYSEREKFKKELTNIISRNRSGINNTPRPPVTAAPSTPSSSAFISRPASTTNEIRPPVPPGNDSTSEFRLRKKVLMSNLELATLHRELVMSGQITEAEFWDGREVISRSICSALSLIPSIPQASYH